MMDFIGSLFEYFIFAVLSVLLVPVIIAGFLVMNFVYPFWEDWLKRLS